MTSAARTAGGNAPRVLMTADAVGGVWSYALELARELGARGAHVDIATMGPVPLQRQRAEAAALPNVTLHVSGYRLEWMDDPWDDVARAGDWLLALERHTAPDVVHLNGYAHAALPWRAPVVVVAHSCVCSWWRAVKGEDAPAAWDRYRAAVTAGIHAARVVVAPTRAMLGEVARWYGAPHGALVVPNGRAASAFMPAAKVPVVFTAGRSWDEAKNIAAVVRTAATLSWTICVAGDMEPPTGVSGTGQSRGTARWLGRLSQRDVAQWMGRAAIYALPARYEPFGLAALEAGLAGCALVLGDIPSLREVWGDAALFVAPNDPDALGDVLRALSSDTERRTACAAACRTRALTYTPERMADGYIHAYELAARRRPHADDACPAEPAATGSTEVACTS